MYFCRFEIGSRSRAPLLLEESQQMQFVVTIYERLLHTKEKFCFRGSAISELAHRLLSGATLLKHKLSFSWRLYSSRCLVQIIAKHMRSICEGRQKSSANELPEASLSEEQSTLLARACKPAFGVSQCASVEAMRYIFIWNVF